MTGVLPRADKLAALARREGWRALVREHGPAGEHQGRVLLTALRDPGEGCAVQWRLLPTSMRTPDGMAPRLLDDGSRHHDWSQDWCYLWRCEHETVVRGYRAKTVETRVNAWTVNVGTKLVLDPALDEVVRWRSERPTPDRVSVTELKAALAAPPPALLGS